MERTKQSGYTRLANPVYCVFSVLDSTITYKYAWKTQTQSSTRDCLTYITLEPVRVPLPIDVASELGKGGAPDTTLFTTEG